MIRDRSLFTGVGVGAGGGRDLEGVTYFWQVANGGRDFLPELGQSYNIFKIFFLMFSGDCTDKI